MYINIINSIITHKYYYIHNPHRYILLFYIFYIFTFRNLILHICNLRTFHKTIIYTIHMLRKTILSGVNFKL